MCWTRSLTRCPTVIGAYRDALKLVQRLKDKHKDAEEHILPHSLTKDLEESLSLGYVTVQRQYDHHVRRFGETYARGDAIAREQMKDILILLQVTVSSHLREVFMDEAALDLYTLKETSDDSRVNATVCLGQLYQRMSIATAAMKQISRPYQEDSNTVQPTDTLAYSSSQSTHSSVGGRPSDNQSATSHTTYSSRTAIGPVRKPSGSLVPQRRISTSAFSSSSEREQPKSLTPGEDDVPALPLPLQRQTSQNAVEFNQGGRENSPNIERAGPEPISNVTTPPMYNSKLVSSIYASVDENEQRSTCDANLPQYAASGVHENVSRESASLIAPRSPREADISPPVSAALVHELDNDLWRVQRPHRTQVPLRQAPRLDQRQVIPLNPDYSTLEHVVTFDARSHPPFSAAPSQHYQQYVQQFNQQPHPSMRHAYYNAATMQEQIAHSQISSWPQLSSVRSLSLPIPAGSPVQTTVMQDAMDHELRSASISRVPPKASDSRPLSIRSSSSSGSKLGSFALRKMLPPGIVDAIHKSNTSPSQANTSSQPRYIKPEARDQIKGHADLVTSPQSTVPQPLGRWPNEAESSSPSQAASLSSADLHFPSETNLAGFCKGAVRQQLGLRKGGFSLEHGKGSKGQDYVFRCTKCNFEGPAAISTALPSGGRGAPKREKTFDPRVRVSAGGIKYRWAFLAKSHVPSRAKSSDPNNSADSFACFICCVEGAAKGWVDGRQHEQLASLGPFGDNRTTAHVAPTFSGLPAFLAHLETHRASHRTPGLMVANEMNCIVGRGAQDHEDFDINLHPLEASRW